MAPPLPIGTYGILWGRPIGSMGIYVSAVWDLWDLQGSMGLRSGTYGIPMGLWDCGVGPMGCLGVCGIAVWDLWDSHGSVGSRCGIYGMPRGLWDCGVGRMGFLCVYGIAVWELWGISFWYELHICDGVCCLSSFVADPMGYL